MKMPRKMLNSPLPILSESPAGLMRRLRRKTLTLSAPQYMQKPSARNRPVLQRSKLNAAAVTKAFLLILTAYAVLLLPELLMKVSSLSMSITLMSLSMLKYVKDVSFLRILTKAAAVCRSDAAGKDFLCFPADLILPLPAIV